MSSSETVYSLSNVVWLLVALHALRERESDTQTVDLPDNATLEVDLAGNVLNKTAQVLLKCQLLTIIRASETPATHSRAPQG